MQGHILRKENKKTIFKQLDKHVCATGPKTPRHEIASNGIMHSAGAYLALMEGKSGADRHVTVSDTGYINGGSSKAPSKAKK